MRLSLYVRRCKEKGLSKEDCTVKVKKAVKKAGKRWTSKMQVLLDNTWSESIVLKFKLPITEDSLFKYLKATKVLKFFSRNIKKIRGLSGPIPPVVLELKALGAKAKDGCTLSVSLFHKNGSGKLVADFDPTEKTWLLKEYVGTVEKGIQAGSTLSDNKALSLVKSIFDILLGPKEKSLIRDKVTMELKKELHGLCPVMRDNLISFGSDYDLEEVIEGLTAKGWVKKSSAPETIDGFKLKRYRFTKGDNTIFLREGGKKPTSAYRGITIEKSS